MGYYNHNWFLGFLLSTTIYCFYGSYLCFQTLRLLISPIDLKNVYHVDPISHYRRNIYWYEIPLYILQLDSLVGALFVFSFIAGIITLMFLNHQLYLIFTGMTTNESFKWDDLKHAIYLQKITKLSKKLILFNKGCDPGMTYEEFWEENKDIQVEDEQVKIDPSFEIRNLYSNILLMI